MSPRSDQHRLDQELKAGRSGAFAMLSWHGRMCLMTGLLAHTSSHISTLEAWARSDPHSCHR